MREMGTKNTMTLASILGNIGEIDRFIVSPLADEVQRTLVV